ncbi:MAG: class I tRNA ligase family protein, partial [Pygmaiobacter sp.]
WPADVHVVGKEILRFHTIIWPAMLMALDLPLPSRVFGNGWLLLDGGKMSKSKGNVVDPVVLCERYGVDAIRYFLLREIPFGNDGIFTNEALINRINSDLANDLGNLLSRTTAMVKKYFDGTLPNLRAPEPLDLELIALCEALPETVTACMDKLMLPQALQEIFKAVQRANKYIDETTPWTLAKDTANNARLATVLYNLCEVLRYTAVLLSAFLPTTAKKIAAQLGSPENVLSFDSLRSFGALPLPLAVVGGEPLFPRIDVAKELEALEAQKAAKEAAASAAAPAAPAEVSAEPIEHLPEITIDDFVKCELRVAKVLTCARMKESKKLLLLTLFDGERERTILSGIAKWYAPEDLIGKHVG